MILESLQILKIKGKNMGAVPLDAGERSFPKRRNRRKEMRKKPESKNYL